MNSESDFRCSDAARLRGDPQVGTAPPARRWLLIESAGNWLPKAWEGLRLDPEVHRSVTATANETTTRILLIRRPGRTVQPDDGGRVWFVVDPLGAEPVVQGRWLQDADLLEAAALLRSSAGSPARSHPAQRQGSTLGSQVSVGELFLVCAHGRHDVCCAVRGRPVAAALAERWPEATWECSHTGGDRFAANLISLPDGVMMGGLDAESCVDRVAEHLELRPDPAVLRGFCGYSPVLQAAMVGLMKDYGPLDWREVRVVAASPITDGQWRVTLRLLTGDDIEVCGAEQVAAHNRLTCSVDRALAPTHHVVRSVELQRPG